MKNWFKRLHTWCMQWVNTKWGVWVLFICSFADASFLPMPTPLIFLALALLNTSRAYKYAIYGILGTFTGAFAGYTIGHYAWINIDGEFSRFAQFLFDNLPGFSIAGYDKIRILYEKWDFWILFVAASLPLPYKIFSISSGVFEINILLFCIATLISQSLKFFLLALLTIKLGSDARKLFEYKWKPVIIITMACLVIVIIAIKVF